MKRWPGFAKTLLPIMPPSTMMPVNDRLRLSLMDGNLPVHDPRKKKIVIRSKIANAHESGPRHVGAVERADRPDAAEQAGRDRDHELIRQDGAQDAGDDRCAALDHHRCDALRTEPGQERREVDASVRRPGQEPDLRPARREPRGLLGAANKSGF